MAITKIRTRYGRNEIRQAKMFLATCRHIGGRDGSRRSIHRYQAPDGSIWEERQSHLKPPQDHYRLALLAR